MRRRTVGLRMATARVPRPGVRNPHCLKGEPLKTRVDRLIRHCERFMSDAMLAHDFKDCVAPLAESEQEADDLERYYNLRRRHKSFQKGSHTHNNHAAIAGLFNKGK